MNDFTQRFWTIQKTDNGCQLFYKSQHVGHVVIENKISYASIDNMVSINYCDLDDLKAVLEVACKFLNPNNSYEKEKETTYRM